MINGIRFPEQIGGAELDAFLAKGWYRLGQAIFTMDYLPYQGQWYRLFWLRFRLNSLQWGKKQKYILSINRRFDTSIEPFELTDELENLYSIYRASVSFDASPTVKHFLYDADLPAAGTGNAYETNMYMIRDNGQLIAVGIFDKGQDSIAGIMNFYHPDYKKYSLGKFMMMEKINYALKTGRAWYYPGYIASGYAKFDYKLFPDQEAAEIFDPSTGLWLPYSPELIKLLEEAAIEEQLNKDNGENPTQ